MQVCAFLCVCINTYMYVRMYVINPYSANVENMVSSS